MRKFFNIFSILMFGVLLAITGCKVKPTQKILVTIGNRTITVADFLLRYRPKTYASEEDEKTEKMKILDNMIRDKLFAIAGEKEGLSEVAEKGLEDYPDRLAVNQLYQEVVVNKAKAGEVEIRRTYRKMSKELHGRHILSKTKEDAEKIYSKLKANDAKNFADLAKTSLDPKTRDKAGDMGWFSWGKMDPEHQEIAYKLKKGQISKPFNTRFGWEIVQIVDERDKKLKPLEDEKANIAKLLKNQKMSKIANNYLEKLKKRAKITYDTTVINMLISKAPQGKPKNPFEPAPLPVLTEEEGNRIIATSLQGKITAADLLKKVEKIMRRPPLNTPDAVKGFIEGDLVNQLLITEAKRMHLDSSPEVMKKYNDAKDSRIAGEYTKKNIIPREEIPENEIKIYYDANIDKYKIHEKRETRIVVVKTEQEAKEIYKKIKLGGDIRKIAKQKSTHYSKKREGLYGPFSETRFPEDYRKTAFTLKRREVSQPFKTKDGFVVMKLTKIEPSSYQTFDAVKKRAEMEIKNEEREQIRTDLITKLKSEIPVHINEDALMMAGKEDAEKEKK